MNDRALEIIHAMTMEQAQSIAQVIHHTKTGNTEAAHSLIEGMDADTRNLLIAYIKAEQAQERRG